MGFSHIRILVGIEHQLIMEILTVLKKQCFWCNSATAPKSLLFWRRDRISCLEKKNPEQKALLSFLPLSTTAFVISSSPFPQMSLPLAPHDPSSDLTESEYSPWGQGNLCYTPYWSWIPGASLGFTNTVHLGMLSQHSFSLKQSSHCVTATPLYLGSTLFSCLWIVN